MKFFFVLIRLPFFIIGVWLWTAFCCIVYPPYYLWFLVFAPVFRVVFVLPFVFISAALTNDPERVNSYLKMIPEKWNESLSSIAEIFGLYEVMWRWFIGQKAEGNE